MIATAEFYSVGRMIFTTASLLATGPAELRSVGPMILHYGPGNTCCVLGGFVVVLEDRPVLIVGTS